MITTVLDAPSLNEYYFFCYTITKHREALSLTNEFKEKTAHIQWNLIAGLRHRLVHDYDSTNWEMIWDIIHTEIPELISQLKKLQEKG